MNDGQGQGHGSEHLDEITLLRLLDDELPSEREARARAHLASCSACRWQYEGLGAETALVRAALAEVDQRSIPERIRPRSSTADLSWVLVAAVAAGIVGISTIWTRFVAPIGRGFEAVGIDGTSVVTAVLVRGVLWKGWMEMATTFLDGVLLLLLGGAALALLHLGFRAWRSSPAVCLVAFGVLAGISLAPAPAGAAVIEMGRESYTLAENEIVDNDLIVASGRIRILGTVTGDLIVAGRLVDVAGEVRGDLIGFAEQIEVSGRIGGNIRAAARLIEIEGAVTRNVTAAGETIRLARGASLGGSYTAAGRESILDGPVERDVLAAAETHEIRSRVGGSALMAGRRLVIGREGALSGETRFFGSEEPEVSPEAHLASPIQFEKVEKEEAGRLDWLFGFVYFFGAAFVLGAAFILVSPRSAEAVIGTYLPAYGRSMLTGLLATIVATSLGILLLVTIVGLPLGLVTLFVVLVGLYVAQAYVGAFIGREILGPPTTPAQNLGRLALGLALLHVAKAVPVVGFFLTVIVAMWGFGALSLWARERAG